MTDLDGSLDRAAQPAAVPGGRGSGAARIVAGITIAAAVIIAIPTLAADPSSVLTLAVAAEYGAIGAFLAVRRPRNPIGWIFLGILLVFCVSPAADPAGGTALRAGGPIPSGLPMVLIWIQSWIFNVLFALYFGLTLVFPSGRLPRGRGGVAARAAIVVTVVGIALMAFGSDLAGLYAPANLGRTIPNPFGFLPVPGGLANTFILLTAVFLLIGVVSIFVRFVRASGIERQQLKWVVASLVLTGVLVAVTLAIVVSAPSVGPSAWALALIGYGTIAPAVGIAVLRYRLYEIDIVVRRTAIYLPLTAVLAGIYAACTAILQRVFVGLTGNTSDAAVILSTLVVAATFTPVKDAIQKAVERRFGAAHDAARVLAAFVEDVDRDLAEPTTQRVMRRFLDVAIVATGAAGGVAYIVDARGERVVGRTKRRSGPVALEVAVGAKDRPLGRLELDRRPSGRAFSDRDVTLLQEAAARLPTAMGVSDPVPQAEGDEPVVVRPATMPVT